MFGTFALGDSSPFAVPSPLSQRACQRDPRGHDPRHNKSNDGATVDAVATTTRGTLAFGAMNGDLLTFLGLPSGIAFELQLERTPPFSFYAPKELF